MTVVVLSWGEAVEAGTAEALTLAAKLAASQGVELHWAVTSALEAAAAALAGLYGVRRLDVIAAAPGGTDAVVEALAAYCAQQRPGTIVVNQSVEGRIVGPRLAGPREEQAQRV